MLMLMLMIDIQQYKLHQPNRFILFLRRFIVRRYGNVHNVQLSGHVLRNSRIMIDVVHYGDGAGDGAGDGEGAQK